MAESNLIDYLKNNVSVVASDNAVNAEQLVFINTLRILVGKGKLNAIYEFIDDFLESSTRKLLVFGIYKEVVRSIALKYRCEKIDGSTDSTKRLDIVRDFAENDERILVGNIQSLGVGTDGLQDACSDMLITEFPDRPGDIDQIVGRLERMGQKNAINIYYSKARETVDEVLWDSLEFKRIVTDGVNKGRVVDRNISVMKRVLQSYLESI
jgi:SNF2 family DNA or RNA helicase